MYKHIKIIIIFIFFSLLSSTIFAAGQKDIPEWVTEPRSIYPDIKYISQIASSNTKEEAKTDALAAISQYFKTSVKSNLTTTLESYNNDGKVSEQINLFNETQITSTVDLFGVEFTNPFYLKKDKRWYCLAFINREKAWIQYEPTIEQNKNIFYSFYTKATESTNYLLSVQNYKQAQDAAIDFLSSLEFARILSANNEQKYQKDRYTVSTIPALKKTALQKSLTFINVENDYDNLIFSAITNVCNSIGLPIQKNKDTYEYVLTANIYLNQKQSDDVIVCYPNIEVSIIGKDGITVYSYSHTLKKTAAYNLNIVRKRCFTDLAEQIESDMTSNFTSLIGLD